MAFDVREGLLVPINH